jgi:hypothetical protein
MKTPSIFLALLFFVCAVPKIASASCTSAVVKFQEYQKVNNNAPENFTSRTITAYLRCDSHKVSRVTLPETTTMHFLENKHGKTCYHDRTCGNIKSWSAFVGVSGAWDWFNASTNFFESDAFNEYTSKTEWKNGLVEVNLALEFGKIERYCKPISEEICL